MRINAWFPSSRNVRNVHSVGNVRSLEPHGTDVTDGTDGTAICRAVTTERWKPLSVVVVRLKTLLSVVALFAKKDEMNRQQMLLMALFLRRRRRKRKRQHRFWVRDIIARRSEVGDYNLFTEMHDHDHESFGRYCRMSPVQFDYILSILHETLSKEVTGRIPITASERLALTIRLLSYEVIQFRILYNNVILTVQSIGLSKPRYNA